MMKGTLATTTISIIFQLYFSTMFAQYDDPIRTISYVHKDTIEEKNIMNLTKDTVFCAMLDTKTDSIYDSDKFYLKHGKIWISYQSENEMIGQGRFKRYKAVRCIFCLLVRPKYWFKIKRKIEHNEKDYLPVVKVGKWVYLNSNGEVINTLVFNKFGKIVHESEKYFSK